MEKIEEKSTEKLPYSVVELEDGVVLVPSKWIISPQDDDKFVCYYTPIKEVAKINEMIAKLTDPQITWKQYSVLKYLKRTATLERGKEKLLEALVLSEIDSEMTENYSEKYKKSRHERVRKFSPQESVNIKRSDKSQTTALNELDDSIASTSSGKFSNNRQKSTMIGDKRLETKIDLPLPPAKRFKPEIAKSNKNDAFDKSVLQEVSSNSNPGTSSEKTPNGEIPPKNKQKPKVIGNKRLETKIDLPLAPTNRSKLEIAQSNKLDVAFDKSVLQEVSSNSKPDTSLGKDSNEEIIPKNKPKLTSINKKRFETKINLLLAPEGQSSFEVDENNEIDETDENTPPLARENNDLTEAQRKRSSAKPENSIASLAFQEKKSGLSYEELSLKKLNEIILLLRDLKIQQGNKTCIAANTLRSFFDSSKCPQLPIASKKDLITADQQLKRKSLRIKLIAALGSIGGRDMKNNVANVCFKLFSNSVAIEYSWPGRKKGKLSLQKTFFTDIIIDSVRKNFPNETTEKFKSAGSKWLEQAKLRLDREMAKQNGESVENDSEDEAEEVDHFTDANDEEDEDVEVA